MKSIHTLGDLLSVAGGFLFFGAFAFDGFAKVALLICGVCLFIIGMNQYGKE